MATILFLQNIMIQYETKLKQPLKKDFKNRLNEIKTVFKKKTKFEYKNKHIRFQFQYLFHSLFFLKKPSFLQTISIKLLDRFNFI
jgi:hypothetical protein